MPRNRFAFYTVVLLTPLFLLGCSSDFQWNDLRTWHFESDRQRYARELENACQEHGNTAESKRVVHVNGVDETYYHTECIPYTAHPPQYMNRMEGR